MFRKKILYVAQLSSVGIAGYCIGQYKGKISDDKAENSLVINGNTVKNMPGLPIFGTVSAAAPYADGGTSKDRISEIMKYGFPGLDNVRSYEDYVLSYDRRNRVPHWVFEHLTKEHIAKNSQVDRSKCDFKPDESIHPFFRSQNSDYKGSGFDRGHMAAAGNHRLTQKHVEQTFYLTNMAPQVGDGFNRHAWNKLEKHVRNLTKVYDNVFCCTGPLYLPRYIGVGFDNQFGAMVGMQMRPKVEGSIPETVGYTWNRLAQDRGEWHKQREAYAQQKEADGKCYVRYQVIGANTVAVPTHFYKVVVCEATNGSLDMEAYVMPNQRIPDETPVSSFMVPPETVERASGLLFFDKLHRTKLNRINGKKV